MEDGMNRKFVILFVIVLVCILMGVIAIVILNISKKDSEAAYRNEDILYADKIIKDVYTDKARYNPGEGVELEIALENLSNQTVDGIIYVNLKSNDQTVKSWKVNNVMLEAGEKANRTVKLEMPKADFRGYLLEVWYKRGSSFLDCKSTAVDVSSNWTKFPRYGYIASFRKQSDAVTADTIKTLNKYHINGLQFYDWQSRHEVPLSAGAGDTGSKWQDIAKRWNYGDTVRAYIEHSHKRNIACMNYNLIFGAFTNYEKSGVKREWGLFKDPSHTTQDFHPLPSTWLSDKLFIFDPNNTDWQNYIINQEKKVFETFDFDGWHIDQLGQRGSLFDYLGHPVDLPQGYLSLIRTAGEKLGGKTLAFNAVAMYGQNTVAGIDCLPFLYAEIWNTSSYYNLKSAIDSGYRYTNNKKSTVLAAYMDYRKSDGEFNEPGVLLTDAVIFASGGDHLELGDHGMLSSEYFPNAKLVSSDSLTKAVRKYYDFMVAYENLLRNNCKPLKNKASIDCITAAISPLPGTVWYFGKDAGKYEVLHLINLTSSDTGNWRDDFGTKHEPELKQNLRLKYCTDEKIGKVLLATPDSNNSRMSSLEFKSGADANGKYIEVEIPSLKYWDMLVFEKSDKE